MNVRGKGLVKVVGSALVYAIVFSTVLKNGLDDPARGVSIKLVTMALPGAFMLAGLIELISGMQFGEVAGAWDSLQGWQRGLLGLFVVVLAIFALLGLIVIFG